MDVLVKYTYWLKHFGEYLCDYLGGTRLMGTGPIPAGERGLVVGCSLYGPGEVAHLDEFSLKIRRVVVMFTGSDIFQVKDLDPSQRAKAQRAFERCHFCVDGGEESRREVEDLVQRPVRIVHLPPKTMHPLRPFPQGDIFHVSFRISPTYPEDYCFSLIAGAARLLPNTFRFHLHHVAGFEPGKHKIPLPLPSNMELHEKPIADMDAFLSGVSCSLRFTTHDTISMVSIEAMMAGRYVLTNSRQTPHAIVVKEEPHALAEALLLARDMARLYPMGNQLASEYYHAAHSPEQFVDFMTGFLH